MAGSVIKSWDTANLLCHLLCCLLCRKPSCKPPCTELHGARGPPEPWGCHPLSLAGTAANGSVPESSLERIRVLEVPWCPSLSSSTGQGCAGHPQHSSCSWVTLLHGGLFLPRTSRNWPCSALSWHSLA